MDARESEVIAEVLGGTSWNSGGHTYLIRIERADGHLIVISDEAVCEYESEDAFAENRPIRAIVLH